MVFWFAELESGIGKQLLLKNYEHVFGIAEFKSAVIFTCQGHLEVI